MNYYISTNITDDDDDGSASGDNNKEGNEFVMHVIPGESTMMMLEGAREGYYYTVTLWAENCFGNSTKSVISFSKFEIINCNKYTRFCYFFTVIGQVLSPFCACV